MIQGEQPNGCSFLLSLAFLIPDVWKHSQNNQAITKHKLAYYRRLTHFDGLDITNIRMKYGFWLLSKVYLSKSRHAKDKISVL